MKDDDGRPRTGPQPGFWRDRTLDRLSAEEWEALCDGCGRCCLIKLTDSASGVTATTAVACRLLDTRTCRCRDYAHRFRRVAGCLRVDPADPETFSLLPRSCAYRRLAEGRALADWHPLVSGDPDSVHRAGISVRAFAVSEQYVHVRDLTSFAVTLWDPDSDPQCP